MLIHREQRRDARRTPMLSPASTRLQISGVDTDYLVPLRLVVVREKELVAATSPGQIQGQTC
jgi:hypothetical protein